MRFKKKTFLRDQMDIPEYKATLASLGQGASKEHQGYLDLMVETEDRSASLSSYTLIAASHSGC